MASLAFIAVTLLASPANEQQTDPAPFGRSPVTRVRFFPAPGLEKAMLGGKFTGSNVSDRTGYEVLAGITSVPAPGRWAELSFSNKKHYRWLRYEAPPGSHGNVAEIEFYADIQIVGFGQFGSLGHRNFHPFQMALDGKTDTWFDSDKADGQYVGTDVGYWCNGAPAMDPKPGEFKEPVKVTLKSQSPNSVIRYSFEGTPGPNEGTVYSQPFSIDHTGTIFAVAYRKGYAPSPTAEGTYVVGGPVKPGFSTFFIGNSLTGSTFPLTRCAFAAGWDQAYRSFIIGGAPSVSIWKGWVENSNKGKVAVITAKHGGEIDRVESDWEGNLSTLTKLDQLCLEVNSVDVETEAAYDIKFFDLLRGKFPQMQPWLYGVWPEMFKTPREVTLGQVASFQMKTVKPAETWEEGCAAWNLFDEDVQTKILQTYKGGKKPRILPCAVAAGCLKSWLDQGKIPDMSGDNYPFMMFRDNFHTGPVGTYLMTMVSYAAFYGESPVGRIPPIGTELNPAQACALQHLAWDVVKNYPDCGLYENGTAPVGKPVFSFAPAPAKANTSVKLSSPTPGAWFRYTLDGTEPTRTRGYVYCGVVTVRPGMTVKAIAYKSGMADSAVSTAEGSSRFANPTPAPKPTPRPTPAPAHANVSYGSDPHQILDVHLPSNSSGPWGAVIWFGGIWASDKHAPLEHFLPANCAAIAVEMRSMGDAIRDKVTPPISYVLLDARRAVQFVRLHAAEWNIDPDRIALGGGSQGTLPALYVACFGEAANPNSRDPVERVSTKVKGVGAWASQPSIDPKRMRDWVHGVEWGAPALGCSFAESLKKRDELLPMINKWSPDALLTKNAPPIYFGNDVGLTKPEKCEEMVYKVHCPQWGLGFQRLAQERGATVYCNFPGHPTDPYKDIWDFLLKMVSPASK